MLKLNHRGKTWHSNRNLGQILLRALLRPRYKKDWELLEQLGKPIKTISHRGGRGGLWCWHLPPQMVMHPENGPLPTVWLTPPPLTLPRVHGQVLTRFQSLPSTKITDRKVLPENHWASGSFKVRIIFPILN